MAALLVTRREVGSDDSARHKIGVGAPWRHLAESVERPPTAGQPGFRDIPCSPAAAAAGSRGRSRITRSMGGPSFDAAPRPDRPSRLLPGKRSLCR